MQPQIQIVNLPGGSRHLALNKTHIFNDRQRRSLVSLVVILLMTVISCSAASLDDYQNRLGNAKKYVSQLLEFVAESENGSRDGDGENETVGALLKVLPDSEKIESSGGSVETANQWMSQGLREFQNEPDSTKRAIILTGINERLDAILKATDELRAAVASGRSKDEDKQKLAEILKREEYQKAEVKEESLFQKWYRKFMEWLESVFPHPAISPNAPSGIGSFQTIIQVVIFALVIGLVGFLIYRFAPFFARHFGLKTKKDKKDRVILGERISADESANDLFSEAERLAREGNLRGAIRKGYIALLCELSDRKVIGLARHKTNRDYLRDVRKRDDLFENMTGLTTNFERNWYGLRPAETQDWEDFRTRYRQTIADV